jgi:hypothetical protein
VVEIPVVDEYFARYQAVEQMQLFRELAAGAPPSVDSLADVWLTTAQTLQAIAADLRTGLTDLQTSWSGETSNEFQYRLGLAAAFAGTLADEAIDIQTGLSVMSSALTLAQGRGAPAPVSPADWEHDAILGPLLGHTATEAELIQSHDRLATVVAELAVSYDLADHAEWSAPRPDPSPDLPGRALAIDLGVEPPPAASPADQTGTSATQLAGTVGSAQPVIAPHALSTAYTTATPAGTPLMPAVPIGTVTQLQGAGTGLASAGSGLTPGPDSDTGNDSSASLPPPVMGGGGLAPGSSSDAVVISRPLYDGETTWADGEDDAWLRRDDPPPHVLGRPNRPA